MNLSPPEIEKYCIEHSRAFAPVYSRLREETFASLHAPQMQVGFLEGNFLKMLLKLCGAKRVLEFGTFSGFSALCFAESLPDDGRVVTCDIDPRATGIAKKFWAEAGLSGKIELRLGPALETLKNLEGPFDLVFIDADKANYWNYFEGSLPLLRTGGLFVIDNVLWSGRVLAPKEKSDHEIHAFNERLKADKRVETLMLPIRDGITLARKL